jgi:hypothetical protein
MTGGLIAEGRHIVHAIGIAPAVVKVKQGADRDGVVDGFVGPPGPPYLVKMFPANRIWFDWRFTISINRKSAFSGSEIGAF